MIPIIGLIIGILIGVFLFSLINRNLPESLAFTSNSQLRSGPVQSSKQAEESTYVKGYTTIKSTNVSDKKILTNKDDDAKQSNTHQTSQPEEQAVYSDNHPTVKTGKKQSNPTRDSQDVNTAASVDNYPDAKRKNDLGNNISENAGVNRKEKPNIIIVGNGVYTIGDRNIVNIN
jgi:uncharacterized membrane-anchored protein YhcB (DUF1043 family)